MVSIGIIGCGNMGSSIASALVGNPSYEVFATDHSEAKVQQSGAHFLSLDRLLEKSDIIILALKPQVLPALYQQLHTIQNKEWISIVAGVSLETLAEQLGTKNVVRFMPHIAAKVKKSVTAVCFETLCCEDLRAKAMDIASLFGSAFILPESQMAAFIGLSGSGIAYVFEFLHAMALGGCKEGIPYPRSLQIAVDTLESATTLQKLTNRNPVDLLTGVCSAGGSTIEGVEALARNSFDHAVIEAVCQAAEKTKRM
jgi:pyrroline-5-carboxylate reductase